MILVSDQGIFVGPVVCKLCGESFEEMPEFVEHVEEAHPIPHEPKEDIEMFI